MSTTGTNLPYTYAQVIRCEACGAQRAWTHTTSSHDTPREIAWTRAMFERNGWRTHDSRVFCSRVCCEEFAARESEVALTSLDCEMDVQ